MRTRKSAINAESACIVVDAEMSHFKSPLDAELAKHGNRYGFLVHFASRVIKENRLLHLSIGIPGLHNFKSLPDMGRELVHDHNCMRCELEKSIEQANRDGWVGLEWEGGK